MFSVLILTKNEEQDLPGCLNALQFFEDVVVYDSYSTDDTEVIARGHGARFVQRPNQDLAISFGGDEGFHRTWGLREITFRYPWCLVLDADERLSTAAYEEIVALLSSDQPSINSAASEPPVAYQLRRRDFFQGRHLKYVQATPWYIRLFRPEYVHYERLINPITVVNGRVASLQGFIDHYPFSKGLSHWIERHNTYSTLEAREFSSASLASGSFRFSLALFSRDFHHRRAHQKQLFMKLPARPLLKFLLLYVFKLGFLDRAPGFTYALLQSIYEYFIVLKVRELQSNSGVPETSSRF
jgi:glycosyltransferase involved in cell wall biosynthesis